MNINDLSLYECCKWIAEANNYRYDSRYECAYSSGWYRMENGEVAFYNKMPIEPTLDVANRCLPDGFNYTFVRSATGSVFGSAERGSFRIEAADTDETVVRFRLAIACRMFMLART
jgi:hypothetical protein